MDIRRLTTREPELSHDHALVVVEDEREGGDDEREYRDDERGSGEEREPIPADDCEALIDDPNDELVEEVEENDVGGIQVEEQASEVLSTHFGDITTWITRWLMLCFL
ncbi:hypothetical protein Bca4012_013226 [Brassica carinata]